MVSKAARLSRPVLGTVRMERISAASGCTSCSGATLRRNVTTFSAKASLPKKPARAVRKIKKGKIENRVLKAMLPASGMASSAKRRRPASRARLTIVGGFHPYCQAVICAEVLR
jgi:hypothetical protein